ncbi:D-alanyl-D-alanine carboxypeptidase/D-alanyl-D-alanine-endopeptidase [Flavihumibacter solisilvae]|uniref:D-alanyl-D-alanine carboxypeptidase n=1 Tax=Flavihumibacter solisilvae TaxID=1349421 RepID=A0A0C1L4H6_9BACT|nr:D-alanyl-D-alanine carboxypeptidase/D-alanyl-D-alanine-endopeptidase [Flavihumibacter solisilvae]KIC94486.1 hypothetical protein OI18_11475 [Flavihumibacter solisilvae]
MKKIAIQIIGIIFSVTSLEAQVSSKLQQAAATFSNDEQLKHATWSVLVTDASTGKTIFDHNSETGLAPASTQKVITSITAFETLGKDFRYSTFIGTDGKELFIQAAGDPSFGSWRYTDTKPEVILEKVRKGIAQGGATQSAGSISPDTSNWDDESIPDGWIWQDIGNYYGAGARQFNWRENQYDILLRSGSTIGSAVSINTTKPVMQGLRFTSLITAAAKGTGDNAYIYHAPGSSTVLVRGTIPVNENSFTISGSIHDPLKQFNAELGQPVIDLPAHLLSSGSVKVVYQHRSPSFDSLNYWFMRKSINLYGEAFLKTMAAKQTGKGTRENGIRFVRDFWKQRGIDEAALQITDGSGLSPQNRVTTRSLVTALQYARSKTWFPSFYESLPLYNGMKLKSGSINGSRAFAGYHTAGGTTYVIAIIVNNYSGSSAAMVKKIFTLLDNLK